jgi:hypothetical protein
MCLKQPQVLVTRLLAAVAAAFHAAARAVAQEQCSGPHLAPAVAHCLSWRAHALPVNTGLAWLVAALAAAATVVRVHEGVLVKGEAGKGARQSVNIVSSCAEQ